MNRVTVWSVQLYTRSAGTGVPVVLLHAFPLSSAMWLAQREGLARACRVITPDLRGFGGSRLGEDEPSIDLMADDVAELLDAEGIDKAVVGGLSMGGYVAMAFCRRHPDRVRGVILADTKATPDPPPAQANRERIAQAVLAEGSGVLVDEVLPALTGPTTRERRAMVFGRVKGLVQSAPPGAVAWAQRAMAVRPDRTEVLRSYSGPSVVVVGEEDELSPVPTAEHMVEALGAAGESELVLVPRAGHMTTIEAPEAVASALTTLLARVEA